MLFKLSLKNIKKSFKDYAIYFLTLILGISIFYVFNSLDSQIVLLDVSSSTYDIIKLLINTLSGVSVFVSFILGFLIIYASRFLIKRRNKEFGIYLTLGMSKRKISGILFLETIIIGIISLLVGLSIGVFLSQFMSILVANMFDADMTKFEFVFSSGAFIKTLIYFSIMYLIVMVFNTISISKCKLIDLLHANKKSEEIKLKNPILCTIVFLVSCGVLGYAYWLVTDGIENLRNFDEIFFPIILGIVTTILIFWSVSGLIIKIFNHMKSVYYRGLNSFVLKQFSSKINTTVLSMSIICLMLFVTICVLSSALTIKNSMTSELEELAPADIFFSGSANLQNISENIYSESIIERSKMSIEDRLKLVDFDVDEYLNEIVKLDSYHVDGLLLEQTLGSIAKEYKVKYPNIIYDSQETILKVSDYNKVAELYGNKKYELRADEYIIIADFASMVEMRNLALKTGITIDLLGHELKPKYDECQSGFLELSSNHVNSGIILVADELLEDVKPYKNILIGNYKEIDKKEKVRVEEELDYKITSQNDGEHNILVNVSTKLSIASGSIGLGALATFIGLYLGIIFLMASAAILALKELSESSDNKERFRMLRKLGTDEKTINRALFIQIGIFFAFPLILALIHSYFGIKFCSIILEVLSMRDQLISIIMTAIFLVAIYGTYFLITYFSSKNIIKEKI